MAAILSLALLTACGQRPGSPPDTSPPGQPVSTSASPSGPPGEPRAVDPRPGQAGVHPTRWHRVEPVEDGAALRVSFWSGVEPCHVLDHVDVRQGADEVVITVHEGHDPARPDTACVEIAVLKATVVRLDAPLGGRRVVDGAV
ncbi:hypothetical protein [Streptoalloteichus tenebrarius]|uniref:hypothetical protein n=1 Tax=Streptoalloteichus tenebrarius (strain ATCC 17920 / DSM 40477 / JCM 4838 / CBS 697.72 / NBRC 16177 / NCIMB 11028 / NRRL B-12390 / A12253. 1 / ISP 5477) TaxID=1933 RepID=UPI0020A4EC5D|nr:hypothetical protein [Streptoalloteichus tenebrarius]